MSLADALEGAASALARHEDAIRPANGDPHRLLEALDAEAAGEVMSWLLQERPDDAEELAEAWAAEPAGVAAILGVSDEGLPKPARKVLRRLHHRLRSRGVETPEAASSPTVARLPGLDDTLSGAYLTPLDPSGARMAYLLESHPQGGARLFELILDDERGIVRFDVYNAGRKKTREFLRAITRSERMPAIETPLEAVKALVAQALERHGSDQPAPKGLPEWRSHVADAPEGASTPGALVADALSIDDEAAALDACVTLVESGRIGPWPPDREVIEALLERFRNAADSPVIVSGATKRGQVDDLLGDAADEVFAGDGAAVAATRLRESAYAFWKQDDEDAARACLAAAARFEAGSPRENPVATALLELLLRPTLQAMAEGEGEADAEPAEDAPLIVEP